MKRTEKVPGMSRMADAVAVVGPSSDTRNVSEFFSQTRQTLAEDMVTHINTSMKGMSELTLYGREEYLQWIERWMELSERVDSTIDSIARNDCFVTLVGQVSAIWSPGESAETWPVCVVSRYNEARLVDEVWLMSARSGGPALENFAPSPATGPE